MKTLQNDKHTNRMTQFELRKVKNSSKTNNNPITENYLFISTGQTKGGVEPDPRALKNIR